MWTTTTEIFLVYSRLYYIGFKRLTLLYDFLLLSESLLAKGLKKALA